MFKRFRLSLLSPLAARLDKVLDRILKGFKHQQARLSESTRQIKDRINMLAAQVDEARNEFHRGFRIQEDGQSEIKQRLDQVLTTLNLLKETVERTNAIRVAYGQQTTVHQTQRTTKPFVEQTPADVDATGIMVGAGGQWLAAQPQKHG